MQRDGYPYVGYRHFTGMDFDDAVFSLILDINLLANEGLNS